jgi:hypothetical protein
MFDAIKRAGSTDGKAIRDALAATKDFPGVTGTVNFNSNRDAVKPIMMIRVDEGGKYVIQERVNVEGASMPSEAGAAGANANTSASPASNANANVAAGNANTGANISINANTNAGATNANSARPANVTP